METGETQEETADEIQIAIEGALDSAASRVIQEHVGAMVGLILACESHEVMADMCEGLILLAQGLRDLDIELLEKALDHDDVYCEYTEAGLRDALDEVRALEGKLENFDEDGNPLLPKSVQAQLRGVGVDDKKK